VPRDAKKRAIHLLDLTVEQPWLIHPPMLATIREIVGRENESVEAVETRLGRKLDNTQTVDKRPSGVAVVSIVGPIVRYADLYSEVSGLTSIETFARDFTTALDDPSVRAIIINVDSPGGQVNGIAETAGIIRAARGVKPVKTYAGNMAASAAYWLGVASDEFVIGPTAMLGSIGTVFSIPDPTQQPKRYIEVVSTQSPKKRPDVTTEAGRGEIQRVADELTAEFISAVAQYRGTSTDTVESDFGQGGLVIGRAAVAAGMADRIGSLEGLISETGNRSINRPGARADADADPLEEVMAVPDMPDDKTFLASLKSFFFSRPVEAGVTPATAPDAVAVELAAARAAATRSAAEAERAQADLEAERKSSAAERLARVKAEVAAFLTVHGARMGAELRASFEALYLGAKSGTLTFRALTASIPADAGAVIAEVLEAFARALPPAGQQERIKVGGKAVDAKVAAVTDESDPNAAHWEALARLEREGVKQSDKAWSVKYGAMLAAVKREMGDGDGTK
jgi:ClpP class serine protease